MLSGLQREANTRASLTGEGKDRVKIGWKTAAVGAIFNGWHEGGKAPRFSIQERRGAIVGSGELVADCLGWFCGKIGS